VSKGFGVWLLYLFGVLLLLAETILPGIILGVIGALCVAASVLAAFFFWGPFWGTAAVAGELGLLVAAFLVWVKLFPESRLGKRMVLPLHGLTSSVPPDWQTLVGAEGILESPCRPVGVALLNGRRYTVLSEEGFLPRGTRVRVRKVEGTRIVVRRCLLVSSGDP
jgi:membrane-bound ClpP family serine protease